MIFISPTKASEYSIHTYNSIAEDFSRTRNSAWEEFIQLAQKTPENACIVDIGCGNGRLFEFFQNTKKPVQYVGIDPSHGLLQEAKRKFPEHINLFQEGSFFSIPLPHESQDEVWAIASFHHLALEKERKKALKNIHHILKENGRLVITVWNLWDQEKYRSQKEKAYNRSFLNPLWNTRDFCIPFGNEKKMRYYFAFEKEELCELLEEEGFSIEECFFSEKKKNICITARKQQKYKFPVFFVQHIPFHIISLSQVLPVFKGVQKIHTPVFITTPNPEMIQECQKNPEFQKILCSSFLSLPDGTGIVWASGLSFLKYVHPFWKWIFGLFSLVFFVFFKKWYPSKIPKPLCGSDVFQCVLESFSADARYHHSLFLLGGAPGSAQYIAENFLAIGGYEDGKVDQERNSEIIQNINNSHANILFVALGAPKQELWISQNIHLLKNIRIVMGVGGSFDFISGHQKRAPKIFRYFGVEWLYRVVKEPKRIQRIWNATGRFIYTMLRTPRIL